MGGPLQGVEGLGSREIKVAMNTPAKRVRLSSPPPSVPAPAPAPVSEEKEQYMCCICREENCADMLFLGCSNRHTICHMCSRQLLSTRIVMRRFPHSFPGRMSARQDVECPLCREPVAGIPNLFCLTEVAGEGKLTCPYRETLHNARRLGCSRTFDSARSLQTHLLSVHNQGVQCPNCSAWLCEKDHTMEDLLQKHVLQHCPEIVCGACNRSGNMVQMYMHSVIGRDRSCQTSSRFLADLSETVHDIFMLFSGSTEPMGPLCHTSLQWLVQYMYQRANANARLEGRSFQRLFNAFVVQAYCSIHSRIMDAPYEPFFGSTLSMTATTLSTQMLRNTDALARRYGLKLNRVSQLPFAYRLLAMTLSDPEMGLRALRRYPKNLTNEEQHEVDRMINLYDKLVPKPTVSTIQLSFPFST